VTADPIRILLADDEHPIRGAMAALLALETDLTVVAQAATGAQAIAMARALRPDVAGHRPQLPLLSGRQDGRDQPPRGRTHRARTRLDLTPWLVACIERVHCVCGQSRLEQHGTQKAWWIATAAVFTLAVAWALLRAFRRADEYLRKIQLESMAIAFAAVLVALQVATLLDAAGVIELHQLAQPIVIGGVGIWLVIADLRTRLHR
jgi:hypothetical protein